MSIIDWDENRKQFYFVSDQASSIGYNFYIATFATYQDKIDYYNELSGDANTQKVTIKDVDAGLYVENAGSKIEVNSDTLVIATDTNYDGYSLGILAFNETTVNNKLASVDVNASKTEITVEVLDNVDDLIKMLKEKGFSLDSEFDMIDHYFSKENTETNNSNSDNTNSGVFDFPFGE